MKPILFSTEMVKAILAGRKTMTRRVIKDKDIINSFDCEADGTPIAYIEPETGAHYPPTYPAKHQPGDILWVRETWRKTGVISETYAYRADEENLNLIGESGNVLILNYCWRPSIFMPFEAARSFLRVTEVRCERVQDMSLYDVWSEGTKPIAGNENDGEAVNQEDFKYLWNSINAKPKPQYATIDGKRQIVSYISYPWEYIHKIRTHRGKPWVICGNPWVWVYSFKRCDKEDEQ